MPSAEDSFATSFYGIYGLQNCDGGKCASQIVQIVISALIIIWLLFQFAMQMKIRMRLDFSWQEVMLVLIFLCLSFNICFMAWVDIILWYVLESLMNQFYFTTLVYYFAKKYIQKIVDQDARRSYLIPLLVGYAFFCLGELGIFIYMVNAGLNHCKQLSELIINAIMIGLCAVFFVLAVFNERDQRKRFEEYKVENKIKNPLGNIWIWVIANILGQIINEVESALIYDKYKGSSCYPITDNTQVQILGPIFMILAQAIPFCSTLWFYSQRRKQIEQRITSSTQLELTTAQVDVQNRIQLIKDPTDGLQSRGLSQNLI